MPEDIWLPSAASVSAARAAAPFFFPRRYAQNARPAMAIMTNATPIPIPASAPGESVLPEEGAIVPVGV